MRLDTRFENQIPTPINLHTNSPFSRSVGNNYIRIRVFLMCFLNILHIAKAKKLYNIKNTLYKKQINHVNKSLGVFPNHIIIFISSN